MTQCVPDWDLADPPTRPPFHSHPTSAAHDLVPMLEYEVAELTWENGQLAMHGLGPPRLSMKPQLSSAPASKYAWDKPPRATGTLESLVNQGTRNPDRKTTSPNYVCTDGDLVPWFADHRSVAPPATPAASAATTMDALVPCDGDNTPKAVESIPVVGSSSRVRSCSDPAASSQEDEEEDCFLPGKRARVARVVPTAREWNSRTQSVSGSAGTFGRVSRQLTLDTCDRDLGVGFTTTTSQGSLENTSSGKPCMKTTTTDDHDSVCHSTPQVEEDDESDRKKENAKSSISTKRSRAAAIHNQSERKRRDKINQRMKTLQKLVPNSNKTDKASMLDEVIEYLKQLQAQVQMMSRMNMPAMMLPMAMQQQLPMASLMAPMGMGMGMGMGIGMAGMGLGLGMDHLNMIATRPALAPGISPLLHPTHFMPIAAWDAATCEQLQPSPGTMMADPLSAFLACQSQPMTMEAYSRIAAMFQQLHQQHPGSVGGGSKN